MSRIRAALKLDAGEEGKALRFAALGAMLQAGIAIGMSTGDALFLTHVGVDALPHIYLLTPVLMLLYIPAYSFLLNRYGIDRAFDLTLGVLIAGGASFFVLIPLAEGDLVYYAAKLYSTLWYIALYSLFWNFVDQYFDILDAKRLFSLFAAGSATGAIAGGLLVSLLIPHMPVERLYLGWALLAVLTFPVLLQLRRRWRKIEVELEPEEEETGFVEQLGRTLRHLRSSSYVRILIAVLFTTLVLTTLNEYRYYSILSESLDEQELAALFGRLFALVNVFNLVVTLFLFNRMVLRFGVRNVALVQPVVYLVVFTLLLLQGGPFAAMFGFFAYHGVLTAIDYNNVNLLYNGIRPEVKSQVRTFIEGMAEPLSTAFGGLFLIVWASRLSPEQISTIGLAGAAVYLLLVLLLRAGYLAAMTDILKRGWLDFSRADPSVAAAAEPGERERVRERVLPGGRPELAHTAVRLLWHGDRPGAVDALLAYLSAASPAERSGARPLVSMVLHSDDADVTRAFLAWIDENPGELGLELVEELAEHGLLQPSRVADRVAPGDPYGRAAVITACWRSWRTADTLWAMTSVEELLAGGPRERGAAIRALGRSRQERTSHFLVPFLDDPDAAVRREALESIRRLAGRGSARLVPQLLERAERGDPESRARALEALGRIADVESIGPLLRISERFTSAERRDVERLMIGMGLQCVPTTVAVLRDPEQPHGSRILAARALARLAFPQFEAVSSALLRPEIERAYGFLHASRVLEGDADESPGLRVLARFYRDAVGRIETFVLELLTLGGRLPSFELLAASLRSASPKERGNAIETLEQGVPREIFRILLPLVDGRGPAEALRFLGDGRNGLPSDVEEMLAKALASPFPLESAAAACALCDRGGPGALEALRARFGSTPSALVRDTILSLLGREGGEVELNLVERVHHLSRTDFFGPYGAGDLEWIARAAEEVRVPPGELLFRLGDPADAVLVTVAGEGRLEAPGSPLARLGPGSVFGEEGIFGASERDTDAVSEGMTALSIPTAAVLRAAEARPEVAIGLLARKREASHAL